MKQLLITFSFLSIILLSQAQTGTVQGLVFDGANKEAIVGAIVTIDGSKDPQVTDLDGSFTFTNITIGTHTVTITFVSYQKKEVPVMVATDKVAEVKIALTSEQQQISEVTVKDTRKRNTENSIITDVKQSSVIVSGISSAQIQRSQDRTASDVVKRIPGVTIQEGKFINIRGLDSRYNTVWLNDAAAPSSESDKRAFSFDIIPSGMLERIMIYKTPSADLPGDFAGGMVKIYTQSIPDKHSISVGYSSSFREGSTFKPFNSTAGSKTDALGFDNGYRGMPSGLSSQISKNDADISNTSKAFNNNWGILSNSAMPDQRANLTLMGVKRLPKVTIGSTTALSYTTTQMTNHINYADFDSSTQTQLLHDTVSTRQVLIGAMENLAIRFGNNTIEFKNLLNQSGKEQTTVRGNTFQDVNEKFYGEYYQARTIAMSQLSGKHTFKDENITYIWNASYSYSSRNEPDFRRIKYVFNPGDSSYKAAIANVVDPVNGGGRFYSKLHENIISFNHQYKQKIKVKNYRFEMNVGNTVEYKFRDFAARTLGYTIKPSAVANQLSKLPIDQIFNPDNVGAKNNFRLDEITSLSDSYKAQNLHVASFIQFNLPLGDRVKLLTGVRYMYNKQSLQSHVNLDSISPNVIGNFLLPSANLQVSVAKNMLVRVAYGETVNFPEFREWSPFYFYDFELRAGNYGSLFPTVFYPKGYVLKTAKIHNVDVRYEWYPSPGDMIQVGGFAKYFIDPIQQVITPTGGTDSKAFTFINGEKAYCFGGEIDIKKNLGFIPVNYFEHFSLVFNTSITESKLTLPALTNLLSTSRLQGQAPYVFNAGIFYQDDSIGLQASLLYNVTGPRIFAIGNTAYPSIGEMPRHSLDFLISYTLMKRLTINVGIQDILNQPSQLVLDIDRDGHFNPSKGNDQAIRTFTYGRYYTVGLKFKI